MNQKKETEIENNRINEIDIAKGIGILCVVVGHRLLAMDISSSIINSFHMPLFFLLSGLVMRPDGRFGWIKSAKAEKKLITNYLFWAVVFIVFDIIVRMLILGEYNLTSLFLDVYMTCTLFGINVLWFVSTLAIGKILAKWVITHVKKSVAQFAIGAIIFIIVAFIAKICISVLGEIHGITRIIYYPLIMILRSIAMAGYVLCGYAMKIVVNMVLKFKLWGGESRTCYIVKYIHSSTL